MPFVRVNEVVTVDILKILLTLLLPPLSVLLEVGMSKQFWINVLLTLLGWLPGVILGVYIIART
jgi:uncharacterized membrane protein YqaE (UPF0057 family)